MLNIENTLDENGRENMVTMTILHSMGGVVVALHCAGVSCFYLQYRRTWKRAPPL